MCEKCERAADELAQDILPDLRRRLDRAVRDAGLGDGLNHGKFLLLLLRMTKLQAEDIGLDAGPVLLRAGGSMLAGVPLDLSTLSRDTVTVVRADRPATTH